MDLNTDTAPEFNAQGGLDVLLDITGGDLDAAETLIVASHGLLVAEGRLTNRALYQFAGLRTEIAARRGDSYPAWALTGETPVRVTVIATQRRGTQITGLDVTDGARVWFTTQVWATADEAARVAGDLAHDLDL